MAEVVMDDMAIGNPASPNGSALALLSLVPRHPYSAVPFQVIAKCGVISLMQRSNRAIKKYHNDTGITGRPAIWAADKGRDRMAGAGTTGSFVVNRIRNWRLAMRTI
jgi:hypothetical protein